MDISILLRQKFANVQTVQAGVTKLFEEARKTDSFYQILRNGNEPLGILMPQEMWEDWLEDQEALASDNYKKKIAQARKETKTYSSIEIKKRLGI